MGYKYKEITDDVWKQIKKELYLNKKKFALDILVEMQGYHGLEYQALSEMYAHGRYKYPITYKYRRELTKSFKDYVNNWAKTWRKKQL